MDGAKTGRCDKCGHLNQREWVLCDACGTRLPWAPPESEKPKIEELTIEQLQTRFAVPPRREPFFLATLEGRPVLVTIVLVAFLIWFFLTY
jgi:hypothetical protein